MPLKRLIRSGRGAWAVLRDPPWAPPGHFYSPISNAADRRRAIQRTHATEAAGVDLRADEQRCLARELAPMWRDIPGQPRSDWRYRPDNILFPLSDAVVYASMLRHIRPARVVEVGSGYTSVLALDVSERWLDGQVELTCIEPYPKRLTTLLRAGDDSRLRLVREQLQSVPPDVFSQLSSGDVLFIDSTHVARPGSDVIRLLLDVLPRLPAGVHVHVHDVFWPFEYPAEWHEEARGFNEIYLLHAFLAFNTQWRVELFADWVWMDCADLVAEYRPDARQPRPSSLWLSRVGP
jgi:hypothetical protein